MSDDNVTDIEERRVQREFERTGMIAVNLPDIPCEPNGKPGLAWVDGRWIRTRVIINAPSDN